MFAPRASNLIQELLCGDDQLTTPRRVLNLLCGQCRETTSSLAEPGFKSTGYAPLPDGFTALLCSRCGSVLPTPDPDHGMLAKLNQLSHFGLGADDRPLLASSERSK